MPIFSPPGNVMDLPADGQQKWSANVQAFFDSAKQGRPSFFSPFDIPAGQSGVTRLIPWNGFPKKYTTIVNPDPMYRYKAVENPVTKGLQGEDYSQVYSTAGGSAAAFKSHGIKNFLFRDQDEYLEWKTFKDGQGHIQKIVFTCDHPEYWKFIGDYNPGLLVQLYRQYVDPAVQPADLLFSTDVYEAMDDGSIVNQKGKYNPFNKWNTTDGILHLSHPANYLSAEVQLAADATILRKDATGNLITDTAALIQCAQYGNPLRSSHPTIGSLVNTLVRGGFSVSINNPVALYIHDVNEASFQFPNGLAIKDFMKVTRGDEANKMILRIEFTPPAGSGVTLDSIQVNGKPLQYGGQIADAITMAIYGLGYAFPTSGNPTIDTCVSAAAHALSLQATTKRGKHR